MTQLVQDDRGPRRATAQRQRVGAVQGDDGGAGRDDLAAVGLHHAEPRGAGHAQYGPRLRAQQVAGRAVGPAQQHRWERGRRAAGQVGGGRDGRGRADVLPGRAGRGGDAGDRRLEHVQAAGRAPGGVRGPADRGAGVPPDRRVAHDLGKGVGRSAERGRSGRRGALDPLGSRGRGRRAGQRRAGAGGRNGQRQRTCGDQGGTDEERTAGTEGEHGLVIGHRESHLLIRSGERPSQ